MEYLVVDDSALNRKLNVLGYRCQEACDGQEAVNMVSLRVFECTRQYDGQNMPVLGGLHAARQLRSIGYNGLIIGTTGDAEYMEHGADKVLAKPIT
jgi:CheY-like chemotaxis protein